MGYKNFSIRFRASKSTVLRFILDLLKFKSVGFTNTFGGDHKFGKYRPEETQRTQTTHPEIDFEMVH